MSLVPNSLIAAEIGHLVSRRKQAKRKPPVTWQERVQNIVSMSKTRFLSVAATEFALHKLHMTLTILRKNKNTTTTNLLTPLSDLRLAQRTPT